LKEDKTLFLILKRKWFDMILSGIKKEEYRELTPYWYNRLMYGEHRERNSFASYIHYTEFKKFDTVTFQLGYQKDAPRIVCEYLNTSIGYGKIEWGATNECFIISLGKILETKNIK